MTAIVCDSSSLISLAETCNIAALAFLRERSQARFVIPPSVHREIITCPINIPHLEFSAVRLNKLVVDGIVSVVSSPQLAASTREILYLANSVFRLDGRPLEIVHAGEAECLAAYSSANASALAIDEKTTRLLVEDPEKLYSVIREEHAHAGNLWIDKPSLERFRQRTAGMQVLRSSELLASAALKGFFSEYGDFADQAFHAGVFALRRAGCSLTGGEISEYRNVRL